MFVKQQYPSTGGRHVRTVHTYMFIYMYRLLNKTCMWNSGRFRQIFCPVLIYSYGFKRDAAVVDAFVVFIAVAMKG